MVESFQIDYDDENEDENESNWKPDHVFNFFHALTLLTF